MPKGWPRIAWGIELLWAIGLFNDFNRFKDALRMEPTKPGEGGSYPTEHKSLAEDPARAPQSVEAAAAK